MRTITFLLLFSTVVLSSCEDPDQLGCTDHLAVNFDPQALSDDGTCEYKTEEQIIWSDGEYGGWNNNNFDGAYMLNVCKGDYSFVTYGDSVLSDTSATDTSATDSVSTDSIPAPSSPESVYLYLSADSVGQHSSYFALLNPKDGSEFTEGSLKFDIRKPDSVAVNVIRVFIDGNITAPSPCGEIRRSGYVEISTAALSDSTFSELVIPIRDFAQISTASVSIVCGFEFDGIANSGFELNNIRWSANQLK